MISVVKDPISKDPNTLLLLHSEDLTDSSKYGHTVTNSGVTVSAAQSKFGGKSLYFNGNSRLSINPVDLFQFGTGDWTFDTWVYPLSQSNDNFFFSGANYGAIFVGRAGGNSTLGIGRASIAWDSTVTSTLILNAWNHVAYVKSAGKIYYFVNGKLVGSANNTISYGIPGGELNIGSQGANYYFKGYMDEVRMSNVARWTENFTPPSAPYVGDSITITPGGVVPQKYALRRRMMRIFSTVRLPKEYQEVEYIQSSGAQYIDSGVLSKSGIKVSMRAALTSLSGAHNLFGALESGQRLFVQYENSLLFAYGAWNSTNANIQQNVFYDFVADFSAGRQSLTVDGATVYTGTSNTQISLTKTVYLAALNLAGTADIFASAKIASCQIYDNNVLIRDFVPCYRKSDGAIGLYDLVNGSFYANAGGGTFTKGADASGTVAPPASGNVTFIYTGKYTDNRISGKGTVRLNSSGVMTVTGEPVTVSVTIVGAGGGAVQHGFVATGGSGGIQTISVTLAPGTYEIVIGVGGFAITGSNGTAGNGGDTIAFGKTSTGGEGATVINSNGTAGEGGTPNGNKGKGPTVTGDLSGGLPNGGGVVDYAAQPGGNGYVEITFS